VLDVVRSRDADNDRDRVVTMLGCGKTEEAGNKPAPAGAGDHATAGSAGTNSGSNAKGGSGSGGAASGAPAVTAGSGSAADPGPAKPDVAPLPDAGGPLQPLGKTVMSEETIGGLKIGSSAKDVIAVLGKPRKKTKSEESEATGDIASAWSWPGVGISMVKTDHGFEVQSIEIKAPSKLATSRGIVIGSSKADVKKSYQHSTEDHNDDPNAYLVGSPYDGELFKFKNGKVTEIFLGQMAE